MRNRIIFCGIISAVMGVMALVMLAFGKVPEACGVVLGSIVASGVIMLGGVER